MEGLNQRRASMTPTPSNVVSDVASRGKSSTTSSYVSHRHTNRIINKFMQRKMENAPPETHELVRKQSVFNFVEKKERTKSKQSNFKKLLRRIRKNNTIIAFVVLVIYIAGGAALFWKIEENPNEEIKKLEKELLEESKRLYKKLDPNCGQLKTRDDLKSNQCLKEIYDSLYKYGEPKQIKGYLDGIAYVLTCITTIGYGQLVCYTVAGKLITVVYCTLGIALTIYVLRHNGKVSLKVCNWFLGSFAKFARICGSNNTTKLKMSVTKSIILLFVFWILGGLGIASYEAFQFWDAIYFSFSTFSTIGFGDLTPKTHWSGFIIFVLHFIDLSLLSMVFVLVHETMENNFMRVLELLDEGYRRHTAELNTGTTNIVSPGPSRHNLDILTAREQKSQE